MSDTSSLLHQLRLCSTVGSPLSDKLVGAFLAAGTEKTIPEGTTLFEQGDSHGEAGYILLDGEVRVVKTGAPETVAWAPELLGEMVLFNPKAERTATVDTANGEIRVLAFEWDRFNDALLAGCTPEEVESIRGALQEYAWEHFAG